MPQPDMRKCEKGKNLTGKAKYSINTASQTSKKPLKAKVKRKKYQTSQTTVNAQEIHNIKKM